MAYLHLMQRGTDITCAHPMCFRARPQHAFDELTTNTNYTSVITQLLLASQALPRSLFLPPLRQGKCSPGHSGKAIGHSPNHALQLFFLQLRQRICSFRHCGKVKMITYFLFCFFGLAEPFWFDRLLLAASSVEPGSTFRLLSVAFAVA